MVAIQMTTATAPPRKRAAKAAPVVPTQTTETQRRTQGLSGLAQLAQGLCLMTGQYADAAAIGQHAPNMLPEVAKLADNYEWLAKPIDLMIEVGPFGALVAAALPFAMQIAANHGWIDPAKVMGQGVVPPQVLEAQMRAQVAQMQAEAMRDQQRAMQDAQAAQREYEEMMAAHNALREPTAEYPTVADSPNGKSNYVDATV